jgi:hypothetical protein
LYTIKNRGELMEDYNNEILAKIAQSCPDFESAYDSPFANAGSLTANKDGSGDRNCN